MIEKQYDILIIGSGASGGVMAKELSPLCDAGKKIAVLEWGAKLRPDEYSGRELEMVDRLYVDSGGFLTKDGTLTIAMGKAYGGSTVVYTGTTFVIPEAVLEEWNVPGLAFSDIKARSEKYMEECNVRFTPPELINENNRLFYEACNKLGYEVEQFPVNIKGCNGTSLCNLGCPHGAKMGTHQVQLPMAEKRGVEVITNCKVTRIEEKAVTALVENPPFGEASSWEPGQYRVRAKLIILCAGSIHSSALLAHSKLADHLPALGRGLTLHPALILVGMHDRAIKNFYGHPKCYYSEQFHQSKGFILETCMYFPFMTAKSMSGFGDEHAEMVRNMDKLQQVLVLAFDKPDPNNRIYADKNGNPIVDYTLSKEVMDSFFDSMVVTAKLLFASGCSRVHAPAGVKFFIDRNEQHDLDRLMSRKMLKTGKVSISAAHPMGGLGMGAGPSSSVTDTWGQVHGVPWLYAADASLFPRCSEVNPYLTVMALADRIAERIRDNAGDLLGE